MKIRGPSDPAGPIEGAEGQAPTPRTSFAERLDRTGGAGPGQPSGAVSGVAEVARSLEAGETTPRAVLDRLIAQAVDAQLGPDAPTEARARLVAAMTELCDNDPLVGERLRRLGEKSSR